MTSLPKEELIRYNQLGLIPGPGEDEKTFSERVKLNLTPPLHSSPCLKEAQNITQSLFDIAPSWVPVNFSNEKLPPWHGACAHILQENPNAPRQALLQLRKNFEKKQRLWGLYDRDEVVAHEMAHIGRMAFDEPKFEEFLAYRTSAAFRKYLGPIVQSATEATLFVLTLLAAIIGDIAALALDLPVLGWMKSLPIILIVLGFGRLIYRHRQLRGSLATITRAVGDRACAILYRLTDQEIIHFSRVSPQTFLAEAKVKAKLSLRWKTIVLAYLYRS